MIDTRWHAAVPDAAKFVEPHIDWATIPLAHFANALYDEFEEVGSGPRHESVCAIPSRRCHAG